jgi:putative transposase
MPRSSRIDIPDLLHHVIVRGIERREIFADDQDRHSFVQRLSSLLVATETTCLAWALLPNHLHLLIRPSCCKLATFMRRLLTGHAVAFNLRHHRSGHLFQNRYKSLVCQEDEYLLQLIRYIHLNPVRANLAGDLPALERYRWSGHHVVMGKQELQGQDVASVLALFGKKVADARRRYREFIADGLSEGPRDDLVGRKRPEVRGNVDSRVLGAPEFVEGIRLRAPDRNTSGGRKTIPEIIEAIAAEHSVPHRGISGGSRLSAVVMARAEVCRVALGEGHSAAEVGRHLGMSRHSVGRAGRRECSTMCSDNEKTA